MKEFTFILVVLLLLNNCTTTEPENKFTFTPEDASCTEVWLNIEANGSVIVEREGAEPKQIEANGSYTFYEEGLKPNTEYNYTATTGDKKLTARITTLDTTSHNFTWESFTFGDYTSVLYDIAIINENDIWAVGDIVKEDSLGNSEHFNAVHWNGNSWELKKIWFYTICGQDGITYYPISSIYVLDYNEIWVTSSGRQIARIIGGIQTETICPPFSMTINKIWGSSPNNVFVVGYNGAVAHYNGAGWTKIESGTTTELLDVYGAGDIVFMGGFSSFQPAVFLGYSNGKITKLLEYDGFSGPGGLEGSITSLWVKNKKIYLLTGYGLYRSTSGKPLEFKPLYNGSYEEWAYKRVRGNNANDIIVVGNQGRVLHFNGKNWGLYPELENNIDFYRGLDVKSEIIAITGERNYDGIERYGLITIGKRK